MTDGLLKELERRLQAGPVRQPLRLVGNLHLHDRPERAGKAGLGRPRRHQSAHPRGEARRRLDPDDIAAADEEGEIIASLLGDESFEGYWRRPDANAKALRKGWYFTGDTGYFDADGRPVRHRPRRRHDHHRRRERLSGGDRKLPVAASGRVRGRCGRPAGRALGQDRRRLRQAARRRRAMRSSTSSAAPPGSPISSGRAVTFSSTRFRNRRSESSCAASWSRANIEAEGQPHAQRAMQHDSHDLQRSASRQAQRLPRRD